MDVQNDTSGLDDQNQLNELELLDEHTLILEALGPKCESKIFIPTERLRAIVSEGLRNYIKTHWSPDIVNLVALFRGEGLCFYNTVIDDTLPRETDRIELDGRHVVQANVGFSEGLHIWHIRVDKISDHSFAGLTTDLWENPSSIFGLWHENQWSVGDGHRYLFPNSTVESYCFDKGRDVFAERRGPSPVRFREKDVLTFALNCTDRNCTIQVNNGRPFLLFENLPTDRALYPAVCCNKVPGVFTIFG